MKLSTIANALGLILIGFGLILLSPILVALLTHERQAILPFVTAAALSIVLGVGCQWYGGGKRNFDALVRNEGMLIVSLTWLVTAALGAIPYMFFGISFVDAYFETVSGLTTTGATILKDFSLYPKTIFFWRGLTQWLGGMGIIVLFVAILPQFAVTGRQMFFAEAPGPTEEKITPRIAHTAKALWFVYLLLTVVEIVLLVMAGMPLFDAVCNSFATMAAGGFSPHPLSILGYNNPAATWIVTVFMTLAGANFALQYRALIQFKPRSLFSSEEFRFYLLIICTVSAGLSLILCSANDMSTAANIRDSFFQVVSILTTTGFCSADFALWVVPAQILLVAVMLVGGCAGSGGGGIKVVRILFVVKYLQREVAQVLHPRAVLPIKIDRMTVPDDIQRQIIGFLLLYIVMTIFSGLAVTIIEGNASTGFVGTLVTIGNIGPGFGDIGPMGSFGGLTMATKIIFTVDMIIGRLELIPILVLFHPDFWTFRATSVRKPR